MEKMLFKYVLLSVFMVLFLTMLVIPGRVYAHKATVFAWVEGDTVHTQSKLSGGKRVTNGSIKVYDAQGTLLVEGLTNDQGAFSFNAPAKVPIVVELNAGMGHMAKWTLNAEDLAAHAVSEAAPGADTEKKARNTAPLNIKTSEDLEVLIAKVMDEKLRPVKKMLAESRQKDPSLSEIFGGIGYIIGLVGLAAYFRNRNSVKGRE